MPIYRAIRTKMVREAAIFEADDEAAAFIAVEEAGFYVTDEDIRDTWVEEL